MRIILTQNVPNLGSLGDEVAVKDGYARNFLLPRGMAIAATAKNAKALQHRRLYLEHQRAEAISAAQGEADKVRALEVTLKGRAGTGGRLFGSVTNRDLQAALAEQGLELDRKAIVLHTPVKTLGTFGATVRLHTDVKVDIDFRVEASEIVAEPKPEGEAEEVPADGADAAAEGAEGAEAGAEPPAEAAAEAGAEAGAEAAADAPAAEPAAEPEKPADA